MDDGQENRQAGSASGGEELDFIELVRVLAYNKYLILGVVILTFGIAGAVAFLSTPIYRAEVLVAPADEISSSASGLSSVLSRLGSIPGLGGMSRLGRQDKVTQGIVTLSSQRFTMEFIKENNLLPVLFPGKWDPADNDWDVEDPDDIPTLSDGYIKFDREIREVKEEDSGIVSLSIEWTDPEQAAKWANSLVNRLNNKLRISAIEEADKTIEILNKEVEKTRIVELRQAIYFMIENQINLRTMANVREEFAFKVISPAIPPEEDQFVRPNRTFIFAVAAVVGPILGVFLSFLVYSIRRIAARLRD